MADELATVFDPKSIEKEIYDKWRTAGAFNAEPGGGRGKYCIVIPPPNVTAPLHLGHALNNTLQDVLIRFRRMQQLATLWMPGTDHAGIATQTVVEKRILAEEGRRRTDFRRDEFVTRIQAWKDDYEAQIIAQLQLMGCSCDWRRTRFTMDDVCARAVRTVFFKLFGDGLIYRGKRLVNWDPATQTVLADDEVEHETVDGHFWDLHYPLLEPAEVGGKTMDHVTVATTRPETMLGDTAVAMNPRDPRAEALVGKMVRLPIVGRLIPIIADDHVILPDPDSDDEMARFSTGFLKVTPAHDPDDYAIGQRHDLEMINVMAPDGSISDQYGWEDAGAPEAQNLLGMDRFEARGAVVEWFRANDLLGEVRPYTHEVGHSYRSHVPIEPYLSDQWYVAVKRQIPGLPDEGLIEDTDVPANSLAGLALKPLLDGRLKFTPDRYAATYRTWLGNLRDWPISRQLWWGHQIPIWSYTLSGEATKASLDAMEAVNRGEKPEDIPSLTDADLTAMNTRLELEVKFPERVNAFGSSIPDFYGKEVDGRRKYDFVQYITLLDDAPELVGPLEAAGWQQDPDVLDTWFSSALWPFSTLGWPEKSPLLETFYPGDVLCTAREIITLWVSRMVMMGQYCLGDIPFSDVFIHAMIQDGEGRKMSKSLGNGIDPLVVIDSHGADAMRFTLVSMTTQTQDVRMPVKDIELPDGRHVNSSEKFDIGRNFCNKLWNASRFALMNLQGAPPWATIHAKKDLADRWILSRLNATIRDATASLEAFRYNELADILYHFMWDDLCDWYLEIAKGRIAAGEDSPKAILAHCLDVFLRLLHPIAPFVTEAIWQRLNEVAPHRGPGDLPAEPMLVGAQWPYADAAAISGPADEEFAMLQDLIRQVRNARVQHNVPPKETVGAVIEAAGTVAGVISDNLGTIRSQGGIGEISMTDRIDAPPTGAAAVTVGGVRLFVLDIIDVAAERARLQKQAETLGKGLGGIRAKLANENFVGKAPADVVQRERERLEKLQVELAAVEESLNALD